MYYPLAHLSPTFTADIEETLMKTDTPLNTDKRFRCGTPFLRSLHRAVKRFEDGEPIGEGFTVDYVEMTVLDDWEMVGYYIGTPNQDRVEIYAPLISVNGETERLRGDDKIEGIKLLRGHEYKMKVRRIYLTQTPLYHNYKMLELISDKATQR